MGGFGSGNHYHWWRGGKKRTVEDCRRIDANHWMREGVMREGVRQSGGWAWTNRSTGEQTASISYEVDTADPDGPWVRLFYRLTRSGEEIDYRIQLQTTRPRFGGLRWWFTCPLVVRDRACGRRAGKLYLPPGGRYFGCRICYDLTYTSCQTHDKRVDFLRRCPDALGVLVRPGAPVSDLILALKALSPRRAGR